jgi:hypothetical protein
MISRVSINSGDNVIIVSPSTRASLIERDTRTVGRFMPLRVSLSSSRVLSEAYLIKSRLRFIKEEELLIYGQCPLARDIPCCYPPNRFPGFPLPDHILPDWGNSAYIISKGLLSLI